MKQNKRNKRNKHTKKYDDMHYSKYKDYYNLTDRITQKMFNFNINNNTTDDVFDEILRLKEHKSNLITINVTDLNFDMCNKVIGLGLIVFVDLPQAISIKKIYRTIEYLNILDSDLVYIKCKFNRLNKEWLYDNIFYEFIENNKLNKSTLILYDEEPKLDTAYWNQLLIFCKDNKFKFDAPLKRLLTFDG